MKLSTRTIPIYATLGAGVLALISWWFFFAHSAPTPHRAQSCPRKTVAENFAAADVVMSGSVFIVIPHGSSAQVIVPPETVYKGVVSQQTLRITATPSTTNRNTNGGLPGADQSHVFASGQGPFIFFLRSRTDGTYSAEACGGTRLLGSGLTTEEQSVLGTGHRFTVDGS